MNAVTRFALALSVATASAAMLSPVSAQAPSEQELYQLCQSGSSAACSMFLEMFPNSLLAPEVAGLQVADREPLNLGNADGDGISEGDGGGASTAGVGGPAGPGAIY